MKVIIHGKLIDLEKELCDMNGPCFIAQEEEVDEVLEGYNLYKKGKNYSTYLSEEDGEKILKVYRIGEEKNKEKEKEEEEKKVKKEKKCPI